MSWIWRLVVTRIRTNLHSAILTAIPTTVRTAIPIAILIVIRRGHQTSRIVGIANLLASAQVTRTARDGADTDNSPNVMSMLAMHIR